MFNKKLKQPCTLTHMYRSTFNEKILFTLCKETDQAQLLHLTIFMIFKQLKHKAVGGLGVKVF